MKAFTTSTLALSFLAAQVVAQGAPIEGYGVVDLEWEVDISSDGRKGIFNGTIEQIAEEVAKINPNWKEEFNISSTPEEAAAAVKEIFQRDTEWGVGKRQAEWDEFRRECFGRWSPAESWAILLGIEYLDKIPGQPSNGPGPGNCGRVSCSADSAIWWCNDVSYDDFYNYNTRKLTFLNIQSAQTKTLFSFRSIANGAGAINRYCTKGLLIRPLVGGQAFHPTNWNVIVRGDWC
ncbi:hypothetical protein EsH8_X_000738 [Colletotrichum jinshuiense]